MKTLTTMAAVAALIAGMSIASAQNAGGPAGPNASPGNINKGVGTEKSTSQSGNQSGKTVKQAGPKKTRVTGKGAFCVEVSSGTGGLNCKYATMAACEKDAQPQNNMCSPNPNKMAKSSGAKSTTGAK